jgi:hypothetical protein
MALLTPLKISELYKRLKTQADRLDYQILTLGDVGEHPLWLFHQPSALKRAKHVLIAAAFHGDEQAGPMAILEFLEHKFDPKDYPDLNISWLPLVNPTGYEANTRNNYLDQNPNRGFDPQDRHPSKEGQLLLAQKELILKLSCNGFLSLHEDSDLNYGFFLYISEPNLKPGRFTKTLLKAPAGIKPVDPLDLLDLEKTSSGAYLVKQGLVFNEVEIDWAFEDFLYNSGNKYTAITETASGKLPLEERIRTQLEFISAFIAAVGS